MFRPRPSGSQNTGTIMVPADEWAGRAFAHRAPSTRCRIAAALPPLHTPQSGMRFRARLPCSCRGAVVAHGSTPDLKHKLCHVVRPVDHDATVELNGNVVRFDIGTDGVAVVQDHAWM